MSTAARLKLIATDLDGTLLRSDSTISDRTRAALRAAEASGIHVVAVTARPPRRVRVIADATGLHGTAICTNGALLYDLERDAVVAQTRLSADCVRSLVEVLRRAVPGVVFAAEVGMHYGCEARYVVPVEHGDDAVHALRAQDVVHLCEEGVTKLIVQHGSHVLEALLALVRAHVGEEVATVTHSGSDFVEIAAAGVTKATALAALCAAREIEPREVIAFGDMPNDLPMMQWAGWSVAVANAHPTLAATTREATASNDEDGVAVVLERLARAGYLMPRRKA